MEERGEGHDIHGGGAEKFVSKSEDFLKKINLRKI